MAHRQLTGVLLVGGASRRFGSPKALARFNGKTFAEQAWGVLGTACAERLAFGKAADGLQLPFAIHDDGDDLRAPLVGIVAGLRAARTDVCVFLPVDCPLIPSHSLLRLAAEAPAAPPTGPLPGAYPKALLPLLAEKLARGDYSLRDVPVTVVELDPRELANVNTSAELAALQPRSSGSTALP